MYKVGFVGLGNMGFAIARGLLKTMNPKDISFFDADNEKCSSAKGELGINLCRNNLEIAEQSKYIILAIKPQIYDMCISQIKNSLKPQSVVISIAPSITIESLKKMLGDKTKVVRVMPNTPAFVNEGMSVLSFSDDEYTDKETKDIENIFKSCGQIETVQEQYMDAIVPISGSSPAYVYMMIEALADGGVNLGLPRKLAYKLAAQTVLGSAKMVLETNSHPGELKDAVCSPGGTTIAAVRSLEKTGFRSSIIEAMNQAFEKTQELK